MYPKKNQPFGQKNALSDPVLYICSAHSCCVSRESNFFLPFPRAQAVESGQNLTADFGPFFRWNWPFRFCDGRLLLIKDRSSCPFRAPDRTVQSGDSPAKLRPFLTMWSIVRSSRPWTQSSETIIHPKEYQKREKDNRRWENKVTVFFYHFSILLRALVHMVVNYTGS